VLLGAGLAWRLWPKARFWWLDILSLALVVLAMVDLRVTQIMGVRLEWNVVTFGDSPVMMWRMAKPYLLGLLGGFGAMLLLYLLAVRAFQLWFHFALPGGPAHGHSCPQQASHRLWSTAPRTFSYLSRWLRTRMSARRTNPEKSWTIFSTNTGCWFALGSFVLLGLLGWAVAQPDKAEGESGFRLVLSSPLWNRVANRTLSSQEFLATAKSLGLDNSENASPVPLAPARDVNVLLVFLESSYNKHLSLFGSAEETQPLLSKYKDRMEIFPNFFSDFAGSIHARFATFTSLYPVRDYNAFTMRRVNVKSVFEVLHEHGYACSMFYSSFFDYTGFGDFLKGRGLDEMYDANTMPGQHAAERVAWGLREDATLEAIRSQIKKYALADQRFFLTYVPAAPHYPYDNIPKEFCKFKKTSMGDYTPAYLNELLYMDFILASIVDQLKESGLLDKTMVIITNDHGEMLGNEGNPIGHGWAFTPELGNTPLIIMDPQNPGNHVNYTIGSQVDLLPTLLARLNLPTPPGQLYEGRSLDATGTPNARRIYLNTLQQFGVLAGNQIFVGERRTGGASSTASGRIFGIANEGTKTLFTEVHSAPGNGISIEPFDDFQENLLRNYSFYSDALTKGKSAVTRQGLSSQ
jgi:arylsulfatase A-like enzyme